MPRKVEPKTCRQCDAPFIGTSDKNYCTLDCQYQWKRDQATRLCITPGCTRRARGHKQGLRCRHCIELRRARRALLRTLTAIARRLPDRACTHCGATFAVRRPSQTLCSQQCSKRHHRHAAKARRRQRMSGGSPVHRARIIERDAGRCQLCRKRVRFDVGPHHPLAPSLDHVVPLAAGGRHEPANVQLAHLRCNQLKSDGGSDQLLLVG